MSAEPGAVTGGRAPGVVADPVSGGPGAGAVSVTLARTRAELAGALSSLPGPRAVVMTMGALHEGHFDLVREAATRVGRAGTLVVTIFVNPLQFGAGEDLEAYPRDLDGDLAGLARVVDGTDARRLVVFAPTSQEMYPAGQPQVRIDPGPMATVLEGRTRPTHFAGVCQVVLTLLHLTRPRWALFGRKDAQQLAVVRAMVEDLAVPVEVVPVGIRREVDGLAMSSRNTYLSAEEREQALALSRSLDAARDAAARGAGARAVREAALGVLEAAPGVRVDYAALVDPSTFTDLAGAGLGLEPVHGQDCRGGASERTVARSQDGPGEQAGAGASGRTGGQAGLGGREAGGQDGPGEEPSNRPALLAVAAWVGSTRLIDNTVVELTDRDEG